METKATPPEPGGLMPPPQIADLGDIAMTFYEAGPRGVGVPVVFCHGFPEIAFSWRAQLKALAAAGRWAAAPDQRGYGGTPGPEEPEAYDIVHLTGDLVRLLDHLGARKAIWCGHDWGGAVVWDMALRHPERTAGVIALNTPFSPRAPIDPIEILRARFGEDMYMVHFQRPFEADEMLGRDVAKTMSFFMRGPPEDAPPSGGIGGAAVRAEGSRSFALLRMLQAYEPAADRRQEVLTPEEMAVFVRAFEASGFTGGVNWYRNISRNWRLSEGLEAKVRVPALMIMAEKDAVLPPSAADGMEAYVEDLEKVLVEGSGHWTQQEAPERTNAILLDWLERRFPLAPGSA
jgi:pimeloyl-ACP methyl ester carboxylesterase